MFSKEFIDHRAAQSEHRHHANKFVFLRFQVRYFYDNGVLTGLEQLGIRDTSGHSHAHYWPHYILLNGGID